MNRRAFCLGVMAFVSLLISQTLTDCATDQILGPLAVTDLQGSAAIVAEIELGKVAMQVSLAAMLVDADHTALETVAGAKSNRGSPREITKD